MQTHIRRHLTNCLYAGFAGLLGFFFVVFVFGCGKKQPLHTGESLDPNRLGGGGATTGSGSSDSLGDILEVTFIVEADGGIEGWVAADLPFNGAAVAIGQPVTNGQTPFEFNFEYPENNFQLADAHIIVDTSRDSSDTEAIFVDGIFTGRPPDAEVNLTANKVEERYYFGLQGSGENTYYIDWSLAHYKRLTRNTFDLTLADLFSPSEVSIYDALSDGNLPVVTGDDSPVYQAFLVMKGLTILKKKASCEDSDSYTFENVFLHNDGNTVGQAAFSGSIAAPNVAWTGALGTYAASEFYFDAALPRVTKENISMTSASLALRVKRMAAGSAAIVINGVGVAQAGFNKNTATSEVESWLDDSSAQTIWTNYMATIPTNGAQTNTTLDLVALMGATKVRDLLAQGKLNVSVAGSIAAVYGEAATSARGFLAPVAGPELSLAGTYFTEICEIPDYPDSPLKQGGLEQRDYDDGQGPEISSLQVSGITSTSAKIIWLTDEASTSQVSYGIKNTNLSTDEDEELSLFHQVNLTGLSPYKYYYVQVRSADNFGNESSSKVIVFVTLR